MAFTCDACRIKAGLEHGLGWPMMGLSYGRCEDCGQAAVCEDLHGTPRHRPKPKKVVSHSKTTRSKSNGRQTRS